VGPVPVVLDLVGDMAGVEGALRYRLAVLLYWIIWPVMGFGLGMHVWGMFLGVLATLVAVAAMIKLEFGRLF
jgi:hypothetical protein